ncbi:alpha/beta fold hydrolase [Sphingomonas morindae]|uniref:Alpha/beta fold hydrolase n=1 Tax=Sphingomonas morindae TaxID=1541170 RepID=A0ABY4X8B2_9SPHN|nr:alpha/beta hydrolase [Sphingomonas morindae]USI73135.1 alpha/beta fold hydrolase [Sphingomonas morindae]
MAQSDLPIQNFTAPDGTRLAWRETGTGHPLVLIHGLFSNAFVNWIRPGYAEALAARGFRVILPDLRGHGESEAPHAPDRYPPDILARDGLALLDHLGLAPGGYDLGGYSLGGRTTLRMLVLGARPRRAVLAGMGLQGIESTGTRSDHFRNVLSNMGRHPRGSAEWFAEAFLRTTGGDPEAMLPLLGSFVDTPRAVLATLATPSLVVAGVDDHDNGSAADLAAALPDARFVSVPGNHMSAVVNRALGEAIGDFLAADRP